MASHRHEITIRATEMSALAGAFHALRHGVPGVDPWDPDALWAWLDEGTASSARRRMVPRAELDREIAAHQAAQAAEGEPRRELEALRGGELASLGEQLASPRPATARHSATRLAARGPASFTA